MNRRRLLFFSVAASAFFGRVSAQVTGESAEAFIGAEIVGFLDSVVVSEVSTWADFVAFVILPLIGFFAITRFLAYHTFLEAEKNLSESTSGISSQDGLSDTGESAANLIAIAVAVTGTMFYGGFSLLIVTILGLIGIIWFIWQFFGAANNVSPGPTPPGRGGGGTGGGGGGTGTGGSGGSGSGGSGGGTGGSGGSGGGGGSGGSGSGGSGGTGSGGSPPGDIDVDVDNFSMAMAEMMQQNQQLNEAMMQFMGLLMDQIQHQGNGVRVNPPGNAPPVMLSPQVVNQFEQEMNVFQPQMINQRMMQQIMEYLSQDDGLTDEDIERILTLLEEWNQNPKEAARDGPTEIEAQLKNILNKIDQYQPVQEIAVEINQDQQFNFMPVNLRKQLFAVFTGDVMPEDTETAIIAPDTDSPVEIDIKIIEQFYGELLSLNEEQVKKVINRLLDLRNIELSSQLTVELLIEIGEMIEKIKQGGGGGDPPTNGGRWEIIERKLRNSKLNPQIKEIMIDVFLMNQPVQKYGLSTQLVAVLRRDISNIPEDEVARFADEIINFVQTQKIRNINNNVLRQIQDFIEDNWMVDNSNLNAENPPQSDNMAGPDRTEQEIKNLLDKIKQEERIEKEVIKYDEDAIKHIEEALKYYEDEKPIIEALKNVRLPNNQSVSMQQAMKEIQQENQRIGVDLLDEKTTKRLRKDLEQMTAQLEKAIEDLKEADKDIETVEKGDTQIEEHLEKLEQMEMQSMEEALEFLNKFHAESPRNPPNA